LIDNDIWNSEHVVPNMDLVGLGYINVANIQVKSALMSMVVGVTWAKWRQLDSERGSMVWRVLIDEEIYLKEKMWPFNVSVLGQCHYYIFVVFIEIMNLLVSIHKWQAWAFRKTGLC
jgi:hypothetical protein